MLKNLLAYKKILAVIAIVIVIIAGVVIVVVTHQGSGDTEKPGVSSDIEKDKDDAQESDDDKDGPYDGTGLEIIDEVDGTVDGVDASGNWDEPDNQTDNTQTDNTQTDDTQSDDTNKENSDTESKDDEEEKEDEDILIDDKIWGEPS